MSRPIAGCPILRVFLRRVGEGTAQKPLPNTRKCQIRNSKGRIYPQMLQDFTMTTITMNEYRK
jgi:hypothetical protein